MSVEALLKGILVTSLQLDDDTQFNSQTALLGAIPEFDSMAVVTVIESVEDSLGIIIEDDEISAEVFETFGSLCEFVEGKT